MRRSLLALLATLALTFAGAACSSGSSDGPTTTTASSTTAPPTSTATSTASTTAPPTTAGTTEAPAPTGATTPTTAATGDDGGETIGPLEECPAPETLEAEGYTCDAEGYLHPIPGGPADPGADEGTDAAGDTGGVIGPLEECPAPETLEAEGYTCDSEGYLHPK